MASHVVSQMRTIHNMGLGGRSYAFRHLPLTKKLLSGGKSKNISSGLAIARATSAQEFGSSARPSACYAARFGSGYVDIILHCVTQSSLQGGAVFHRLWMHYVTTDSPGEPQASTIRVGRADNLFRRRRCSVDLISLDDQYRWTGFGDRCLWGAMRCFVLFAACFVAGEVIRGAASLSSADLVSRPLFCH